jgi:hypothetical protein
MRSFRLVIAGAFALALTAVAADVPKAGRDGWIAMFDGRTLDGWQASEKPENWKVEDGAIVGRGDRSHLFWTKQMCENCEFRATVKINKGGNSGMYFRAQEIVADWPKGYEAQVNTSHGDPVKTGSLYNIAKVLDKLVPEETWFTQHIVADGDRIVIRVNDKVTVDTKDSSYAKGYLALQQHDPGSVVMYKDLMFRPIKK